MADISYISQSQPLGLGHAIYCAKNLIAKDEYFAVLLGDDIVHAKKPCLSQLVEIFTNHEANISQPKI